MKQPREKEVYNSTQSLRGDLSNFAVKWQSCCWTQDIFTLKLVIVAVLFIV